MSDYYFGGLGSRGGDNSYAELLTAKIEVDVRNFEAMMKLADMQVDKLKQLSDTHEELDSTTYTKVGHNMIVAAIEGMEVFADKVMVDSLIECPEEYGILRDSHAVSRPFRRANRIVVEMGYGYGDAVNPQTGRTAAQYAVPVHEIYHAEHVPPTKSHFLIDPLMLHASEFGRGIAMAMRIGADTTKILGVAPREIVVIPGFHPYGVPTGVPAIGGGVMYRGVHGWFTGSGTP